VGSLEITQNPYLASQEDIDKRAADAERKQDLTPEGTPVRNVEMSAYSGDYEHDHNNGNKSAMGTGLRYGANDDEPTSAAANWAIYPPGTQFRVDGKLYEVDDYGSYINRYPHRIDLYMQTNARMNKWGLQRKDMTDVKIPE